ncbi:MAG: hypothetical protein QW521_03395 [Desulfurococcaceae archaeon]
MGDVKWVYGNIFTSYDMSAEIMVDVGYAHRLKVYEAGDIVYIDDTITGTNRPPSHIIQVWSENPHGSPPTVPVIYTVYVDVYDTNNVLKERFTLKYLYGSPRYTVYINDEYGTSLISSIYYAYTVGSDVFGRTVTASYFRLPEKPFESKLFVEVIAQKDSKKYYYVATEPTLYTSTVLKLYPVTKVMVAVRYDLTPLLSVPIISEFVKFVLWLGVKAVDLAIQIARVISRAIGIDLPIVGAEYNSGTKELVVYYEVDPVPVLAFVLAIVVAVATAAVAIYYFNAVKEITVAEKTYSVYELVKQMYDQYTRTIKEVAEYAKTTPDPTKTLLELLPLISPPNVSLEAARKAVEDSEKKDTMIEDLKKMLILGIGGAVIITALSMARR